jgi:hypothetical protein
MFMSNDRIHDCLDGRIPREALSADERQRLAALEATLREASAALRAAPTPDLTSRVMAALPAVEPVRTPEGVFVRVARWLWAPINVTMRPAYGMGALAATLAAVLLAPRMPLAPGAAPVASAVGADTRMYVQFRIEVPGASQVAVAGTFTGWKPDHELTEVSPGVWSVMVPLDPGVHDYTFVIDGDRMVVDPYAPHVADSFGGSNSRLFLPAPNGSA